MTRETRGHRHPRGVVGALQGGAPMTEISTSNALRDMHINFHLD